MDPRSLMQGDYMALSYALVAPFNEQFNAEQENAEKSLYYFVLSPKGG